MSSQPLVRHIYTADPSANVFEGKLFIYPSHDIDAAEVNNDDGDHFRMEDYHVFSMTEVPGEATDHGTVLSVDDVPWAARQMWAPDAAAKNGKYFFYFPAKDRDGIFRIGVAVSDRPEGPFRPEPAPIPGANSIDPCAFVDDDGSAYLYWGGLWGGQLEKWRGGSFDPEGKEPAPDEPAVCPKGGRLSDDMLSLADGARDIVILDEAGKPLLAGDEERRYFEGPWMHKYNGVYYFSYSTGTSHYICYATGESPLGPFRYRGRIMNPVLGWTTHHSIVEFRGRWYLFYHDASLSGGIDHLRCVKMKEFTYGPDGEIGTMDP